MDDRPELERIVSAARRGDQDALARLFDEYYGAVYRYAFARLRNVADAEDAAADTFTTMLRALPRFEWRGVPFEAWLFRIAMSRVVDVARRRARMRPIELDVGRASANPDSDPARVVPQLEARRELVATVERLPVAQRDVVMLRFFLGYSIAETARSLGRSEGAVKQLQLRAIANLRRLAGR